MAESQLDVLNRAPVDQVAEWLAACNGSRHWVERAEVTDQLAQITRLRLEKLLAR